MKKLNIRPDTGVYGTYKRISYQPWTALAEFVDTSKLELQRIVREGLDKLYKELN